MNYYYDTEFLEGTQTKIFLGIHVGKTKPTIDLISIGIVSEDDREYYAISKDFNLKEAWNRFDTIPATPTEPKEKVYWIRENVLKPIWVDFCNKGFTLKDSPMTPYGIDTLFTYNNFKKLLKKYGKSNKQIASEIIEFCNPFHRGYSLDGADRHTIGSVYISSEPISLEDINKWDLKYIFEKSNPVLYAYYGAYDHVAFCWLFGKMINLPKGFPMYSVDLKQMLDERLNKKTNKDFGEGYEYYRNDGATIQIPEMTLNEKLKRIKEHAYYPKQENVHNALDDARWNKKLHGFIKSQL